jgi:hypothetical protein
VHLFRLVSISETTLYVCEFGQKIGGVTKRNYWQEISNLKQLTTYRLKMSKELSRSNYLLL